MAVAPHLHIGFVEFLVIGLYIIVWGFLFRTLEIWMHNNPVGQAMSFIY